MGYADAVWFGDSDKVGIAVDTNGAPNTINLALGEKGNVRETEMTLEEAKRVRQILDRAIKTTEDERWSPFGVVTSVSKFLIGAGAMVGLPGGLALAGYMHSGDGFASYAGVLLGFVLCMAALGPALNDPRNVAEG